MNNIALASGSLLAKITRKRISEASKHTRSFSPAKYYAWFNFTFYHPPPGQPWGKVQPFGPGGGELFEPSCPGGRGRANLKILVVLVKYVTSQLTPDRVEKTAYFQGESPEFVADWLGKLRIISQN